MKPAETARPSNLPAEVESGLQDFLEAAKAAFGSDLLSLALYGSAAEGKMRATSDVNVLLVLAEFSRGKADAFREPMRLARAEIHLKAMFLLQSEIPCAFESFAQKFEEIQVRHRVLYGAEPFAGMAATRENEILNLRRELLNQVLRLRASTITQGLREEQLALVAAKAAGPLRSCAVSLILLEGGPRMPPKDALEKIAAPDAGSLEVLQRVSQARTNRFLPPGAAAPTVFGLMELARKMHARAQALR
ncbi:MAG TPA: nucleotidyltransferase domain-containing protein [Candidatus Acidoferrales bacterium]|nr:nucleotidyltransferase domain-containing protein [Candidatus Acidoferrales bacterium]